MDHARHLSSPSPTSPFLFHHSDRSSFSKSNPLTPLLSSTAIDVTNVDDCFSNTSTHHHNNHHHLQSNSPFEVVVDQRSQSPLVDNHSSNHQDNNKNLHHHHHHHHSDSLTGVDDDDDDDDGMHNMLSGGSSSSSTSTMPLLNENHSHHSFSRISLEEYSPLSLVEDCDNALPISPTSLACASHHSYKSSLNGLKIDNLVGDVHDHDDVNDARSLSPSLLSSSVGGSHQHNQHNSSNNHNLWSNSSTAIFQNTSLLNSTSTSFLLNQHHQQQLNSLMQQLEPQSLDEAPQSCLISNNSSTFDGTTLANLSTSSNNGFSLSITNRPSSEPPPNCEIELSDLECKSLNGQHTLQVSKIKSSISEKSAGKTDHSVQSIPTRSRRRRNKSAGSTNLKQKLNKNAKANNHEKEQLPTSNNEVANNELVHSSKVHLQLNHHKKLQELQKRLFGTQSEIHSQPETSNKVENSIETTSASSSTLCSSADTDTRVKEEPDSAGIKDVTSEPSCEDQQLTTIKTRIRPSRSRRSKAGCKNESSQKSAIVTSQGSGPTQRANVSTEKVEPDTTTKSSPECTKLADLLSDASSCGNTRSCNNQSSFTNTNNSDLNEGNGSENGGEKRLQHIQVQMSPSLTVVAANASGLLQPITIQQSQSQTHDNGSSGLTITSSGGTFTTNQIFSRSQPTIATVAGNQLKGIVSSNDLLKSTHNDTVVSNWTLQPASNTSVSNTIQASNNGVTQTTATIGAHQIAIQVICQDGTSLVLPVSSAAGLNAAVSLTSQHQHLQAVLANNAAAMAVNQQQRSSPQNQSMLPLMSVSNIVAQQQNNSYNLESNNAGTSTNGQASSGLAASSPTLAALLDAGTSSRNFTDISGGNLSSQNLVSTNNLLRKLVSGNTRIQTRIGDSGLLQGSDINLTSCGTLVNTSQSPQSEASMKVKNANHNGTSEKRVKLENSDGVINSSNNMQTTLTLIDPQGLIIATSADKIPKQMQQSTSASPNMQMQSSTVVKATSDASKQNRMGSSTGNRQVDPTQPFRCEHCNSTFTRLGNFTRHKKIHTVPTKDGQRFKCDVCKKSFLQRCDLARHLHIHRGTEPHRCNICGKGYIRHSDLVTHQRFHNKEKPFGCPHCSKGFCQRGDLNRHLRSIHLQMKPILCPCCNRKFAKQETLLRHLNTAHGTKPVSTNSGGIITELSPEFALNQGDDKQTAITVVASSVALNDNSDHKATAVASLQAIRACKIPQSVDPSTTSELRTISASTEQVAIAKAT